MEHGTLSLLIWSVGFQFYVSYTVFIASGRAGTYTWKQQSWPGLKKTHWLPCWLILPSMQNIISDTACSLMGLWPLFFNRKRDRTEGLYFGRNFDDNCVTDVLVWRVCGGESRHLKRWRRWWRNCSIKYVYLRIFSKNDKMLSVRLTTATKKESLVFATEVLKGFKNMIDAS